MPGIGNIKLRYNACLERTADMGMAEPSDPRTDTSSFYSTSTVGYDYYSICNSSFPLPVWIDPCKYKDNDPRRPIDPTPLFKHVELSKARSNVYARQTAPTWKPRTAVLMRSDPRWRSGRWKAKT